MFACSDSAKLDGKGVVDDSQPPSTPLAGGKADGSERAIALEAHSPHPYTNNIDRTFAISFAGLPACATSARLHFRVLRTEADYDFVTVEPIGAPAQSFHGTHDDTWTEWFPINGSHVEVRLDTDGSITRHGFEIDQIEWDGLPAGCPLVRFPPCADDAVDLAKRPGTCECPAVPQCALLADVEVRLQTSHGHNNNQKRVVGGVATESHPGPTDALVTTEVGTLDQTKVRALVRRAAESGLIAAGGYDRSIPSGFRRDELQIIAGGIDISWVAREGGHAGEVQSLIDEFDAIFTCGTGGALSCGSGLTCEEGACIQEASCVCPAVFDPVCGGNGRTFSNSCSAACANVEVVHDGECGITGDFCGGLFGFGCAENHRCRYGESAFVAPFPDAGGTCVTGNYCDAPADCNELIHPAVPGSWACQTNSCSWKAGLAWKPAADGRFETAHPYANSTSVWKQLYLPAEAQALRLVTASFKLERDFDFLEVWTWTGQWTRVARFTGAAPPAATTEFAGRFHYLRFVSDSSVTDQGFRVDAEWR